MKLMCRAALAVLAVVGRGDDDTTEPADAAEPADAPADSGVPR